MQSVKSTARVAGLLVLVACISARAQTVDQEQSACPNPAPRSHK